MKIVSARGILSITNQLGDTLINFIIYFTRLNLVL